MNKICTTIEQSKKLIELGIDVKTADMIYNTLDVFHVRHDTPIDKYHTPAWSLSALLGLIPNVEIKSKVQNFDNKSWCISSHDDKDHNHIWVYNDKLIDACVELIIKFKGQNLI